MRRKSVCMCGISTQISEVSGRMLSVADVWVEEGRLWTEGDPIAIDGVPSDDNQSMFTGM